MLTKRDREREAQIGFGLLVFRHPVRKKNESVKSVKHSTVYVVFIAKLDRF